MVTGAEDVKVVYVEGFVGLGKNEIFGQGEGLAAGDIQGGELFHDEVAGGKVGIQVQRGVVHEPDQKIVLCSLYVTYCIILISMIILVFLQKMFRILNITKLKKNVCVTSKNNCISMQGESL